MTTWARIVTSWPRTVLALVVPLVLLSGVWGIGVLDRLNLAGYTDPGSESARADELTQATFGRLAPDILVLYTAPDGQTVDDIGPQVVAQLAAVDPTVLARPIESYWTSNPLLRQALVAADRSMALAVVTLDGTDTERLRHYADLVPQLTVTGVDTQFAGYSAVTAAFNEESKTDVAIAEAIAIPLTLVLLVVIFGGLVAAPIPVIVGVLTVFSALGVLHAISIVSDVSAFALNVTTLLGLGLAIDYGLFMVSRFREELPEFGPAGAAARTVQTSGRTIAFSALLMTCAFAGALAAPISMLRSLGFGAIAAVVLAAFLSLTAVPAALTLLGPRIDALPWRRGAVQRGEARARRLWGSVADRVLRRPVVVAVSILALLALLSAPALGIQTTGIDVHGLPPDNPTRIAQEHVTTHFPNATNGATLVVHGADGAAPPPESVARVMAQAQQVDGVRLVVQLDARDDVVLLHAALTSGDFTDDAWSTVDRLRTIADPPGATVLVGGENALGADTNAAILHSIPLMLTVMVGATLVVMFFGFRSIVLPLKAVAMAAISLTATLGVLTWVFQEGHGAGLFGAEPQALPLPALVVVVGAVFGLSTDYEVFLMSRMVEAHDDGASTHEAIRTGIARTGRVITAAAMLLIIVTGATALSDVSLIKIGGIGMAIAILIDATVVRMLLVPALVKLMGRANWWVPRPLARHHRSGTPASARTGPQR